MENKELVEIKNTNNMSEKELFSFAGSGDRIHDAKFETKPIGYFKDAMIRFRKNKGSVFAFFVIMLLVLYAILVPIFTNEATKTTNDSYYKKMGPRTTWGYNIGMNGGSEKEHNEYMLLNYYSIGVGAEYSFNAETKEEHIPTFEEGLKSYFQPVVDVSKKYKQDYDPNGYIKRIYSATVDTYLGVGFEYKQLEINEYEKIKQWEKETGNTVFYPLIDTESPYCLDPDNPDYWYKMSRSKETKFAPVNSSNKAQSLATDSNIEFVDIYLRNSAGEPIYTRKQGDAYKCRVLYYNFYRYIYDHEPNYLFGTDSQGYDLAYRLAQGMGLSFILAICVSTVNFVIGAIYGAIEGYYGGTIDLVLERISDILVEVPFIVVATLFQLHFAGKVGPFPSLLFAFVLTGWIGTASRVRTQFYRFKNQEYVLAARTLGARDARVMWKHIFPNTLGTIITSSVLVIPGCIFSESMLSYLGIVSLGTAESTSLGTLISEASKNWTLYPHLMVFPAIVICLLMICFNLFGNGLRDAFNPTLRGAE